MSSSSPTLKIDLRIVCAILVLIIASMLGIWRPWQDTSAADTTRKITITGDATVKGVPDEFVFYPSFERTGTDVTSMKNDLNTFGTKLVADMKKLGIASSDVTLDSSSYDNYTTDITDGSSQILSLQVTITVPSKDLAQKVQDYLASTDAKGRLTAQPQFSTAKEKDLQNTARQQAVTDARKKATETASNVDAKLGKVLEVNDQPTYSGGGCGTGTICPLNATQNSLTSGNTQASLPVTPGNDEVSSSVQVVFALD
jgi:uncharacterized protein YggE